MSWRIWPFLLKYVSLSVSSSLLYVQVCKKSFCEADLYNYFVAWISHFILIDFFFFVELLLRFFVFASNALSALKNFFTIFQYHECFAMVAYTLWWRTLWKLFFVGFVAYWFGIWKSFEYEKREFSDNFSNLLYLKMSDRSRI